MTIIIKMMRIMITVDNNNHAGMIITMAKILIIMIVIMVRCDSNDNNGVGIIWGSSRNHSWV